jgi:hypothetical protein
MAAFMNFIRPQPPRRVHINLNAITADGLIRVRRSRADGPVAQGQLVEIFEPTDEIEGIARVARVNDETGLIYLDVEWGTLHDLTPVLSTCTTGLGVGQIAEFSPSSWLRPQLIAR